MEFLISLLSGAVGGNLAGAVLKKYSLGTLWNSVVGILGGGLGAQLLGMLNIDISGIIGNIAGSGVGGAVLLVIVGLIKSAMAKS
ncbi:hypothetical protein C7448_101275 [Tenacibaculum gallaicum]|uniref:Transglycosylase associated protein n=1 Tax=Tenacibaculum gallaicum TaxID=561505 RepID=A0A3E0IC88_9FLAO|nr:MULTISPECIES: hypothetical protein [Tenacibaculum]MDO6674492.1 hypothetical protein [Tenacibaculum sp. 1_MG-2023]REH56239.1 hypothetical protein C7448_101275 [Tenacibaculum gallaicum]